MVVILVVTTIITFVLIDLATQSYEAKKQGRIAMAGEGNVFTSAKTAKNISQTETTRTIKGIRENDYRIPQGLFFHKGHTWANIMVSGYVKVGIDDFAQHNIGRIDEVVLPPISKEIKQGGKAFTIRQGNRKASFKSPVSGVVCSVNAMLLEQPDAIKKDPYVYGWICAIKPGNLSAEISGLKIAKDAALWLKDEVRKFKEVLMGESLKLYPGFATIQDGGEIVEGLLEFLDNNSWKLFEENFLKN